MPTGRLDSLWKWLGADAGTPAARPEIAPGLVLGGRYRLEASLGKGAAAVVYRAHDTLLDHPVAVKILLLDGLAKDATPGSQAADMRAEAKNSLRLSHPNIVHVFTYEKDLQFEFLVMELIEGRDLWHYCRSQDDKHLHVEEVLRIGIACCDALAYAHDSGMVHNDVKPGNVLIDDEGHIKIVDFGLASFGSKPTDDPVAGSPVYMAPERIKGGAGDGRSDVYSLGATLFALATGEPPFGRDTGTALRGHLKANIPTREEIPAPLDRLLRRAMDKSPDARFASAHAFRDALVHLLHEIQNEALTEVAVSDGATAPPPPTRKATPAPTARKRRPTPPPAEPRQAAPAAPPASPSVADRLAALRPPAGMTLVSQRSVLIRGKSIDIAPFFVDVLPVTNEQWRKFVEATGETPPAHWMQKKPPPGKDAHPVVGVPYEQVERYLAWSHKRLPTEAEWMSLVHGPDGMPFPWGGECGGSATCHCPRADAQDTAPAGAHPAGASPEGVLDLLGNVWEWTATDPRLPPPEAGRAVALGGSFRHVCAKPGEVPRSEIDRGKAYLYLGFRCAADVEAR